VKRIHGEVETSTSKDKRGTGKEGARGVRSVGKGGTRDKGKVRVRGRKNSLPRNCERTRMYQLSIPVNALERKEAT